MGRPKNTEERREQIVEGLLAVMAERGYESASVARIGKAAGLTPGLVHYHFENKQAVLVELVQRLVNAFDERFQARAARAKDPLGRLDAFIDAHLALDAESDPRVVRAWVLVGAEAVRQPEVQALYADSVTDRLDRLSDLLRDELRARGGNARRARAIASGVLSAIEGAFLISAAAPSRLPTGYAAPTVRRMVRGLLDAEVS